MASSRDGQEGSSGEWRVTSARKKVQQKPAPLQSVLVTVCEYMRKLMENSIYYFPAKVQRTFIANKGDIGFDDQNGPQIAPESRAQFGPKPAKSCRKLAKRWQKVAEKRGFWGRNLIKFVSSGGSSQALKSAERGRSREGNQAADQAIVLEITGRKGGASAPPKLSLPPGDFIP